MPRAARKPAITGDALLANLVAAIDYQAAMRCGTTDIRKLMFADAALWEVVDRAKAYLHDQPQQPVKLAKTK